MPARLHPQDAEAIFLIMVGDPFDKAGKNFGPLVGRSHVFSRIPRASNPAGYCIIDPQSCDEKLVRLLALPFRRATSPLEFPLRNASLP